MLSHSELLRQVHYDPVTGVFTRLRGRNAGTFVSVRPFTYGQLWLQTDNGRKKFWLHRLAWFYIHSEQADCVDHKDGRPHNNKLDNLRSVSRKENSLNRQGANSNSLSGVRGVSPYKDGRWKAVVWTGTTTKHIGVFDTIADAVSARDIFVAEGVQ